MTHGTLIVLEGIDGSGKATQSALLEKKLKEAGKDVMHISFPDYASDSSALVKMYLKGDFGADPGDVNPYAASLFYAVDRFASYRMKWKDFYEKGGIIIADRYTTSNMVHQMTKYDDEEERTQFLSWLEKTEYGELELPRPDLVILLDIPLRMSEALVKARAAEGVRWISMNSIWTTSGSAMMPIRRWYAFTAGSVSRVPERVCFEVSRISGAMWMRR